MTGNLHTRLLLIMLVFSPVAASKGTGAETVIIQARQFTTHQRLSNNEIKGKKTLFIINLLNLFICN